MADPRFGELSDRQKDVLKLVAQGLTAPEIAHQLGIAVPTVHQRLAGARNKLGATSSRQAARLFVGGSDGESLYHPALYDEMTVEAAPQADMSSPSPRPFRPWPTPGRPINDMSAGQRIILVVGLAAGIATIITMMTVTAVALNSQL